MKPYVSAWRASSITRAAGGFVCSTTPKFMAPRLLHSSSPALASTWSTVRPYASIATRNALSGESSIAACEIGGSDCAKIIAVGTTRPISVASWSGPLGTGSPSPPPSSAIDARAAPTSTG